MEGEEESKMIYDKETKTWLPKYSNDLIAEQQSAYTVTDLPPLPPKQKKVKKPKEKQQQKKKEQQPELHIPKLSESSIYVKNLPKDVTSEQLVEYFSKAGILMPDLDSCQPRIKIYQKESHSEAYITYYRKESVDLAITLLDETEFQKDFIIKIEKPKEEELNEDKEKYKKKSELKKLEWQLKVLESKLDWKEDELLTKKEEKQLRTVILKHCFTLEEIQTDPSLILAIKQDVAEECEKLGEVTIVNLYDNNPDGVLSVRFKDAKSAKFCVQLMHGRYFGGQQIEAKLDDGEYYGTTDRERETEEEEQRRLENYSKFLETEEQQPEEEEDTEQPEKKKTKLSIE